MKNNTIPEGKLTSFYHMLNGKGSDIAGIVIPQMQRDYAQGRDSAKLVRARFLSALFKAIDGDDARPLELDFIYGVRREISNGWYNFYPIDGQQRLTTLFLLHLYLIKRLDEDEDSLLGKFSYETRDSSKQFCKKLREIDSLNYRGIKAYVEKQWWFTSRWKADPTIHSMLTMLGDIDAHYAEFTNDQLRQSLDHLMNGEYGLGYIRFYRLYLDDLQSPDDMYIKMNSRGKPLTEFEHFKAELESYIDNQGDFTRKMDTTWTQLMWAYRDTDKDKDPKGYTANGLDARFMAIFRYYMIIWGTKTNLFGYSHALNLSEFELAARVFKHNPAVVADFTHIMDFFHKQFVTCGKLESFFAKFVTKDECSTDKVYIEKDLSGGVDYLKACCISGNNFTLRNVIMFECFLQYARFADKIDETSFIDRLRVVRNLCRNSTDDMRQDKMTALLNRADAIIAEQKIEDKVWDFTILQKEQETFKLQWLQEHETSKDLLYRVENHGALHGNLSPIIQIEDQNRSLDEELMRKFLQLFGLQRSDDYTIIERVLLASSKNDYSYWNRGYYYGGSKKSNWNKDIFVNSNKTTPPILQAFLKSQNDFSDEALTQIIDNYKSDCETKQYFDWKYYVVRYKGFRHGDSAKYTDWQEYSKLMLRTESRRGYNWNPFLFTLSRKISGSKLGNYDAPLVLEEEHTELRCRESEFELILNGVERVMIPVPQKTHGDKHIDTVDRIQWLLNKAENQTYTEYWKSLGQP